MLLCYEVAPSPHGCPCCGKGPAQQLAAGTAPSREALAHSQHRPRPCPGQVLTQRPPFVSEWLRSTQACFATTQSGDGKGATGKRACRFLLEKVLEALRSIPAQPQELWPSEGGGVHPSACVEAPHAMPPDCHVPVAPRCCHGVD
ncbi:hypothetical protein TREES_T100017656 [Tupaia chinensis]|uniref:Uncharacterized protein n=1 Tax=Tupaia chinensis TaxID=246437 RepID=L9L4B4_TUPCH|nr:hypothetical protein TREES_T100017656 [Tupaia chinensis]